MHKSIDNIAQLFIYSRFAFTVSTTSASASDVEKSIFLNPYWQLLIILYLLINDNNWFLINLSNIFDNCGIKEIGR